MDWVKGGSIKPIGTMNSTPWRPAAVAMVVGIGRNGAASPPSWSPDPVQAIANAPERRADDSPRCRPACHPPADQRPWQSTTLTSTCRYRRGVASKPALEIIGAKHDHYPVKWLLRQKDGFEGVMPLHQARLRIIDIGVRPGHLRQVPHAARRRSAPAIDTGHRSAKRWPDHHP